MGSQISTKVSTAGGNRAPVGMGSCQPQVNRRYVALPSGHSRKKRLIVVFVATCITFISYLVKIKMHCVDCHTVEPPITDPLRSEQPLYSGQVSCYGLHLA